MERYSGKRTLTRYYFRLSEIEQVLMFSCLFSVSMVCFRVFYTGSTLFLSMIWNLFLAFIPYLISKGVERYDIKRNKLVIAGSLIMWLLFIPNTFYIITDLFHLDQNGEVPLWYDLALLLSCAWNGLLFGILSVRTIEKWIERYINKKFDLLFIYPVMVLNAFGVYLGRYLRFNSWDVVTNPFRLMRDIIYLIIHPLRNRYDWSMILCYSVLMTLMYITFKKVGRAV